MYVARKVRNMLLSNEGSQRQGEQLRCCGQWPQRKLWSNSTLDNHTSVILVSSSVILYGKHRRFLSVSIGRVV